MTFYIVQGGSGGYTFAFPSNVKGFTAIATALGKTNTQSFFWNGSNWVAENAGTSF